ncbi:MAG: cell division ATP-binding protein FtsE [Kistimonas sp.]|nr:cell division ATP-binding protein FtsE [Kistimonas sp.]
MIVFEHVSKRFPNGYTGLDNVSLHIRRGEMVFLTGHSGAGKSTLLRLVLLMDRPSSGRIQVGGYSLSRLRRGQIPALRRHIGVVFQDHQLLADRSVFENVAIALRVADFYPDEIDSRVRAALDMVGLLDRAALFPEALSGGELQRVGIARAMVTRPTVLLADEPTGNLDPALSADIMQRFNKYNQAGMTILVATHDLDLVRQMGHRTLTLEKGRLVSGAAQ